MAVPKKRHSNTRTNKRRANWKLFAVASAKCPQCGSPILPHTACKNCGTYKGRAVLEIKQKKSKQETAKESKQAQEKEDTKGKKEGKAPDKKDTKEKK